MSPAAPHPLPPRSAPRSPRLAALSALLLLAACDGVPAGPLPAGPLPAGPLPADRAAPVDEGGAVVAALVRGEHDRAGAVAALTALDTRWSRSWAVVLLLADAPVPADAAARATALWERTLAGGPAAPRPAAGPPTALAALREARFAGEDEPTGADVPCWIAARWPEAWYEAFRPWHGSSRDLAVPRCDPPVDAAWIDAHAATADRLLGPPTGACGTIRYADLMSAHFDVFRAWHAPRSALGDAAAAAARDGQAVARAALLDELGGDAGARADYLGAVVPDRAWERQLGDRMRALGLSVGEADAVLALTAARVEAAGIRAALACPRGHDPDGG